MIDLLFWWKQAKISWDEVTETDFKWIHPTGGVNLRTKIVGVEAESTARVTFFIIPKKMGRIDLHLNARSDSDQYHSTTKQLHVKVSYFQIIMFIDICYCEFNFRQRDWRYIATKLIYYWLTLAFRRLISLWTPVLSLDRRQSNCRHSVNEMKWSRRST